jgi:sulfate adenylyltransferase
VSTPRGFAVFLTGLSGSGKTTIANALHPQLAARTRRPLTLLDGDVVRQFLSSELGFSREHRDLNVRRIGWVAADIIRHGGMVICAVIAPYDDGRKEVRRMIEPLGGFLLVHVSTPLEVCESRDPKGHYSKARAGELPQFTGVSDPYEPPTDAELTVNTEMTSTEEACAQIMSWLESNGFLGREP